MGQDWRFTPDRFGFRFAADGFDRRPRAAAQERVRQAVATGRRSPAVALAAARDDVPSIAAVVLHLRARYVSKAAILGGRGRSCRSKNRSPA
jgi:hypothetical protein